MGAMRCRVCSPFVASIVVGLVTTGCVEAFGTEDPHDPGTSLGKFHVTAAQTQNDCGDGALGAPATWEFDVRLAWEDDSLFWNSGGDVIVGVLSADRTTFEIQSDVVIDMRTEEDAGKPPCTIDRHDVAKGTLEVSGEGEGVSAFGGTLSYAFTPADGSDCSDLSSPETPVIAGLPCSMKYTFDAPRTGD